MGIGVSMILRFGIRLTQPYLKPIIWGSLAVGLTALAWSLGLTSRSLALLERVVS